MYPRDEHIIEVRKLVRTAFNPGLAAPPEGVVDCEVLEDDDESAAIHADFVGKNWWDVDYATLFRHRDCIPLFSTDGFVYYAPAFLLACLEFSREEAHDMCSWALMNLNPVAESGEIVEFAIGRLNAFTVAQRKAVANFVALFLGLEDPIGRQARTAYSAYWASYI